MLFRTSAFAFRILVCLICVGCSVRPLYEQYNSSDVGCGSIHIDVIPGRNGQKLRGYLSDAVRDLYTSNRKYILAVNLSESYMPYALENDGNAQRLKVFLVAHVILKNLERNVLLDTNVRVTYSKNTATSQGDVLLSMYGVISDSAIRELSARIMENVMVSLRNEDGIQ